FCHKERGHSRNYCFLLSSIFQSSIEPPDGASSSHCPSRTSPLCDLCVPLRPEIRVHSRPPVLHLVRRSFNEGGSLGDGGFAVKNPLSWHAFRPGACLF